MPFNFSWLVPDHLAGMARPGSGLEYAPEMLPHEHRFLSWLNTSRSLEALRAEMPERLGLGGAQSGMAERRLLETYRKFRRIWPILSAVREGFGEGGEPVDRFVRNEQAVLDDLAYVKARGIRQLISLTERPLAPDLLEKAGVAALHLPVPDLKSPTRDQIETLCGHIDACLSRGEPVAVHCLAGIGRTGTALACYLVHCGAGAEEAIREVRSKRPGSIETDEQEQTIHQFEGSS